MIYLEAPNRMPGTKLSVFLAGGISGCPDWQTKVVNFLTPYDIAVFNPRRKRFPMDKPEEAEAQIVWEFEHLNKADIILFWFCKDTLCPIVLYELGAHIKDNKPICVGVEPGYQRERDVKIQAKLARPDMQIVDSIDELCLNVKEELLKEFMK